MSHAWEPLQNSDDVVVPMKSGTTWATGYTPVIISAGTVIPATNGARVFGVAIQPAVVSGDIVDVIIGSSQFEVPVMGGVTITPGDHVAMGTTFSVDLGTSGDLACGVAVGEAAVVSAIGAAKARIVLVANAHTAQHTAEVV